MRTVPSAAYKILRALPNTWYEVRIVCGNRTYEFDTLKSVTVHQALTSGSGMVIGGAVSAECNITVVESSANWPRMAQFTLQFKIRSSSISVGWMTFGTFYTDERYEDKHGNLTIKGYDKMLMLEQYWASVVPSNLIPSSWPITAKAFCQMVQSAGLCTFESLTTLDNTVAFIGLDTGSTIRDKLRDIAASHGGNWVITSNGSLRLVQYASAEQYAAIAGIAVAGIAIVGTSSEEDVSSAMQYPDLGLSLKTFETSPALARVSGATLETDEGDSVSAGTDTTYMLKGTCNYSNTNGVAELCLSRVQGYSYRPFQITGAYLDPIVEVGDIIVADHECLQIMSLDWNFNKYPTASLSAPYDAEVDHEYTYVDQNKKSFRKGMAALNEAEEELYSSIEQTASSIKTTVAASQKQYDTEEYTVNYYGFGTPASAGYNASGNNGKYYLNQSNGDLYRSNGTSWSKVKTLSLITSVQQTEINQNATDITAKVSKQSPAGQTSFSWAMNDSSHTWYANGSEIMKLQQSGLTVTGKIQATSGYIGSSTNGFTIDSNAIYNAKNGMASTSSGVYVGKDGIALGAYNSNNGSSAFQVTKDGVITARSGTVGGFTLSASSLYNGKSQMNSQTAGVYMGTNGIALGAYDTTNGNPFEVSSSGVLKARSGTIGGFTLAASAMYTSGQSNFSGTGDGIYLGSGGFRMGSKFKVTNSGEVTASGLNITGGSIKLGGTTSNPVFSVTSTGAVTASNLTLTGGSISIRDNNNNVVFSANSSGVTVNGNGTFTGTIYAGNIVYYNGNPATYSYGTFNGAGISTGTIAGGVDSYNVPIAQLSATASQGVTFGNQYGLAIKETGGTYPAYFAATHIVALNMGFYSGKYYVDTGNDNTEYDLAQHYHQITVENGKVKIGKPTKEEPDPFDYGGEGYDHASVLDTNSTNYTSYDTGYSIGNKAYNPTVSSGGSSTYMRLGLYKSDNSLIKTLRLAMSMSVTRGNYPSGEQYWNADKQHYIPYYKYVNGNGYVRAVAKIGTTEVAIGDIEVNTLVNDCIDMGGGGSHSIQYNIYKHYDGGQQDGWDCYVSCGDAGHTFWSASQIYA